MKTELPAIGRPSIYGLSLKQMGRSEYEKALRRAKRLCATDKRWRPNLNHKILGHTEYMRQWRKLRKERSI